MSSLQKIKRALISVSDKKDILQIAEFLIKNHVEIISTGGTSKLLKENNIKVKDISEFTGFPEIMDGRVKTLHPKVHGGLLGILDDQNHQKQMSDNQIESIDLVIINLYPFVETVKKGANYSEVVENIDIGGPSMIRSAAKNHDYKTVITKPSEYEGLIEEMKNNQGATSLEYRKNQAREAFITTANYDQAIACYFNSIQNKDFTDQLLISATIKQELRYGENSHQRASVYIDNFAKFGIVSANQLQGKELSYNNFNDADAALNIALEFDKCAAIIVKHTNPCGVAIADNILSAYQNALEADSKSAFGGIVALNRPVDKDLALEISKLFYEVIIAPSFTVDALEIFASKKNLRLLEAEYGMQRQKQIKSISGGYLVQDLDDKIITAKDLKPAGTVLATPKQIEELLFAMMICKNVKSNAIVVANNFQTVGIGAGQMNRVDSVEIACKKANGFIDMSGNVIDKSQGAVLASDAFFPFADGIEFAAKYGITAIIAPSGSIRDEEVIAAANKNNIALIFISSRHFKH